MNSENSNISCYLSIFDTLVIHYIGYLCLIFRAMRIFNIINIEVRFLDDIYDFSSIPSINHFKGTDSSQLSDSVD